jgi:hypothetical protein
MKFQFRLTILGMAFAVSACTTNIHAKDETVVPPSVPFGAYKSFEIAPLTVAKIEGEGGDLQAVETIRTALGACLSSVVTPYEKGGAPRLKITPVIENMKKVGTAERLLVGALAGSSAVLLNVRYTDSDTKATVANPTFYAKAAAMSGAWTFGIQDDAMLDRIVQSACDYTKENM